MLTRSNRSAAHTLLDPLFERDDDAAAPAIIYVRPDAEAETLSRGALRDSAVHFAGALHALGVRPKQVVVVAHAEGLDAVRVFLGALRLGAIPSMFASLTEKLDPDAYRANMRLLVHAAGARLVVTSDAFLPELHELIGCRTAGFGDFHRDSAGSVAPFTPAPDAVAFLQHSSGTTGLQKGIALSHRAVLNQIASYSDALRLTARDVVVSWLPLYHDMGLIAGFLLPVVQGVPLVLMSPFDWVRRPALLLRALDRYRGTLCWLPNFAYNHCARRTLDRDLHNLSLESVRAFINCSEPALDSSQRAFVERFAPIGARVEQLAVSYAMAENVFAVTQTRLAVPPRLDKLNRRTLATSGKAEPAAADDPAPAVYVSCGPPIPDVKVRIERGLPDRSVGEIQIRSHCMLDGYHGRPGLNAELFDDGWYRTGDLGYLASGELYVVGRKKDLIITAGKNVHPHDLEAIVNSVEGVHPGRVVVFGVPDETEGTELVAVVAEVDSEDPDARRAVGAALRLALAGQAGITASYVHLVGPKWLLKTSSGKIARAANRDKWLAERTAAGRES